MASVTVTIPDDQAMRIANAICGVTSYQPTGAEDAIEHVKNVVFEWLTSATINWEADQAAQAVRTNITDPLVNAMVNMNGGRGVMAQFILDVPDESAERIATAVCVRFGFDPEAGITPVDFTKQVVFAWLRDVTLSFEADQAADAARTAVLENPDDPLAGSAFTQG